MSFESFFSLYLGTFGQSILGKHTFMNKNASATAPLQHGVVEDEMNTRNQRELLRPVDIPWVGQPGKFLQQQ